ncbi:MAG: sialidase family protein, partial [Candidatus Kapaibacterium sp.]
SSDAGRTWKNINLGKPAGLNFIVGNDPSVAWDAEGRGYLVYGGFDAKRTSGENGVFMSVTTDNGTTWTKHLPVILHTGVMTKDSAFEDKYYISIDNARSSPYKGHLYIPWKRVYDRDSSTQIVITKSTDRGATWSVPKRVSSVLTGKSLDTTFGQSFPIAATGPDGQVYVAWNHGPLRSIGFASSTDGGMTWTAPRTVITYEWLGVAMNTGSQYNHTLKGGTRVETYPSLVVDTTDSPRRGWLYLSWAADRTPNVYFARSTDNGATWSTPRIVHRDTTNDQFWQWMAIDGTSGDLAITFLDSRDDPENRMSRAYVSISRDGGETWTDRAVGDAGSDIRRNPFGTTALSGVFAGDYSGCAFIAGKVYPSHVDMRNTYPVIADNDVYSAIVNVNAPMPVENLRARTIVTRPSVIALSWTPPVKRVFGEILQATAFRQVIRRDAKVWRVVDGSVSSIEDDSLAAYSEHTYDIVVAMNASADSSVPRSVTGYAGGAPQPLGGVLRDVMNDTVSARLRIRTPSLRADSVNPLVNMAFVRVYTDSLTWTDLPVDSRDTARDLELTLPVAQRGFYDLRIAIGDDKGNISTRSEVLTRYLGPILAEHRDAFDTDVLARYLRRGGWTSTDEFSLSPMHSITESKRTQYSGLARDTMRFFPVRNVSADGLPLSFAHAAIIDKSDTAFVEYATYRENPADEVWKTLAWYNRTLFTEWQNAQLDQADWRTEVLRVPAGRDSIVSLRLRFKSNIVTNADGWFVDDLAMGMSVNSVSDAEQHAFIVTPEPSSDHLVVWAPVAATLEAYTLTGECLHTLPLTAHVGTVIATADWTSGAYVLVFKTGTGVPVSKVVRVLH